MMDKTLTEMDKILEQLIDNAKHLKGISTQAISKEILSSLQNKQEELVNLLLEKERSLQKDHGKKSPKWAGIQKKLAQFQKLNDDFIENLRAHEKLIDFKPKFEKISGIIIE